MSNKININLTADDVKDIPNITLSAKDVVGIPDLNTSVENKGFFEKAYDKIHDYNQNLGEFILGKGAIKKAPEKPAILSFGEDESLRNTFLKNAAKQTFGSNPAVLEDDIASAVNAEKMFNVVSDIASRNEKQYKDIVSNKDKPWEEKSQELTQMSESFAKPYLDNKNELTEQLKGVNQQLDKLNTLSNKATNGVFYPSQNTEDEFLQPKIKSGVTLADFGNEINSLQKKKLNLETQLQQNEKEKKKLDSVFSSPASYLNPIAEATRDNPQGLIDMSQEDFGFELAKTQAEVESMSNSELKAGRLYPYTVDIEGKPVKNLLSEKFSLNNSNLFNWWDKTKSILPEGLRSSEEELLEDKLGRSSGSSIGGITRQIQIDAYNGANTLEANIEANKKAYEKNIQDLQQYRLEEIAKAKKSNTSVSPDFEKGINAKVSEYTNLIDKQNILLEKTTSFKNSYLKTFKEFEDYKQNRDNLAKTWNFYDDIVDPLVINPVTKVANAPQALVTYKDAIATGIGVMSKEEQTAKQLSNYYENESNPFTYIPEPIKNEHAFALKDGQGIKDITFDNFNLRASAREGIKTTVESLLLYQAGVGIGEATKLAPLLEKYGKVGKYFSDKIGIIPASNLLLNSDIHKENVESYLRGDLSSINEVVGRDEVQKMIEGATEMLWTPEANLLKSVTKEPLQEFAVRQLFKKALGESLITPELKYLAQSVVKNLVATPLEESFEEVAGNKATDILNKLSSKSNLTFNPEEQSTLLNNFDTAINTTIGMLPTMLFGLGKAYTARHGYLSSISYEVGANADELLTYAQDYIKSAKEEDLKKVFPNFTSKEQLFQKVKQVNSDYKKAYEDASPITSKMLTEAEKLDYFNTIYTYNQLVKNPETSEQNLEELSKLQESILKVKDGVAKREFAYKNDYKKALSEDLDTILFSLATTSANIPTLQEVSNHLTNLSDKFYNDAKYSEETSKINTLKKSVDSKISKLKEAAVELSKTSEEKAQENNQNGKITIQRPTLGNLNLEFNTPYYLSTIEDISVGGAKIKQRPLIQILQDNGDGTVSISSDGEISTIPIEDLSKYKFTKKSTVEEWRKSKSPEAFVFDHENDVFSYEFSKPTSSRDKKVSGRIQYNKLNKNVEFIYKDKTGKTVTQVLSKEDLQKINSGKLKYVRTLETEQEFKDKQDKITEKSKQTDFEQLENQTVKRWEFIQNFLQEKTNELKSTKELISKIEDELLDTEIELEKLQEKLSKKESITTKKGKKRADVKKLFDKLNSLKNQQTKLSDLLDEYNQQKQDLESQIEYTKQYEGKDFESNKSIVDQLVDDQFNLELQLEQVNDVIDYLKDLSEGIAEIINKLLDNIDAIYNIAKRLYPRIPFDITQLTDFVRKNPNIVKLQPDAFKDINEFNEIINNNLEKIELKDKEVQDLTKSINANIGIAKNIQDKIRYQEELISKAQKASEEFKEEKTAKKIQSIADKIFLSQKEVQTENNVNDTEEDKKLVKGESAKIDLDEFFSTATSGVTKQGGFNLDKPNVLKLQNFLNSVEDPSIYSLLAITKDNAKSYGLEGILFTDETTTNKSDKEDDNDIKLVIVVKDATGKIHFVDETGSITDKPTKDNVVTTSLRKGVAKWSDGEKAYVSKGKLTEEQENKLVAELENNHKEFRQAIIDGIKTNGNVAPFKIKYISRGFTTQETNESNSAIGTVIPESVDLVNTQVIQVPSSKEGNTGEVIYSGSKSVSMPVGRPVISHNQFLQFLHNKKFTAKEVDKFIKVFKALYDAWKSGNTENIKLINTYLQKTLYFRNPESVSKLTNKKQETSPGRSQIWFNVIDNIPFLNLSQDFKFPFNFEEGNPKAFINLQAFFQGKEGKGVFHNIDNQKLIGEAFTEIVDVSKDGKIQTRVWGSYQQYLLSNKYPDGKKRPTEEIPLTVNLNESTPTTPNIAGRYIVFENKANQSVVNTNKQVFKSTTKQNTPIPTAQIDENTVFEEAPSDTQDASKLTANKLYRWKVIHNGEEKFIDFTVNDKKYVTVLAHNWGVDKKQLAISLKSYIDGKPKPSTVVIYSLNASENKKQINLPTGFDLSSWGTSENEKESTAPQEPVVEVPAVSEDVLNSVLGEFEAFEPFVGDDTTNYRTSNKKQYKLENLKEAKSWFESRFPNVEFKLAFGLIDGKAWGRLKNKIVTLSDVAEEGTIYHEAFEVVHKYILSPKQLKSLYKEFKNRKGTFVDFETGKTVKYSEANNHQIKEQLAEEYREYELSNGKKKWNGEYNKNSLFRKLLNFIDFITNGLKNPETINEIFSKISNGAYRDFAFPTELNQVKPDYKVSDVKHTNPVFFNDVMKSMTNLLFEVLSEQNRSIPEIFLDNYDIEAEQALVKTKIDNFYGKNAAKNIVSTLSKEAFVTAFSSKENLTKLLNGISKISPSLFVNFLRVQKENGLNTTQFLEKIYDTYESYSYIDKNWDNFKKEQRNYLSKYSIEFKTDEEELSDEIQTDENKNQNDYLKDTLKLSRKLNASTEIKLLIATLRELVWENKEDKFGLENNKTAKPVLNSILMSNLVDYNKTIISLLYKLSLATNFQEMETILKQEAVYNPSLQQLIEKLKLETPTNQLSEFDIELRNKFYTSLNNMKVKYNKLILDLFTKTGKILDLNEANAINLIKKKWFNATRANTKLFKIGKNSKLEFVKSNLPITSVKNLEDALSLLNSLGYEFKVDLSRFTKEEKETFLKSSLKLFKTLTTEDAELLMYNSPLIRESLNELADLYIKYTDNYAEPQHLNIEREPVQNIILHNFIGSVAKVFNISNTFDDFIAKIPQLNPNSAGNAWLSYSQILSPNSEFFRDGNRTRKLSIEIVEGSEVAESREGTPTSKLSIVDRIAQEFSFNLQGLFYILTPADTKTEWGINFGHFVTQSQAKDDTYILNIFKNYLKAEIATVQQKNTEDLQNIDKLGKGLRFFKDILKDVNIDLKKSPGEAVREKESEINKAILNYVNTNTLDTYNYFSQNNIIIPFTKEDADFKGFVPINDTSEKGEKFSIMFAPSDMIGEGLTTKEINDLIRFNNLNYTFNIIEQHKLFWGDPAQWKDITKRTKSFTSGRNLSVADADYFNDFYNKKDNTLYYTNEKGEIEEISLQPGDFGYINYDGSIKTQTYQDVIVENDDIQDYEDINEADAQGYSFPLGTREIRRRSNTWSDADQEQFEWDNALCRKDNNLYPEGERGTKLKTYDEQIIKKGNPYLERAKNEQTLPVSNVLKPIYSGFKDGDVAVINLDKLSLASLSWRLVKGTQAEAFYLEHFKKGTTYVKFESANKVGLKNDVTPLYDKNGKINTQVKHEKLSFKYFGIQVETNTQKNKTTLGTQLTKLITLNIDKIKNKLLVDNNSKLLSALKEMSKNQIFKDFGIKQSIVNGKKVLEFKNFDTIEKLIQRELNNRDSTQNLKDAMKVNPDTGNFYLKWDLVIGSERLESIITSIIDKNILRPKMFGGQMPQIASTLFEKNKRFVKRIINGKPVLTSNELKFYEDADGKRYCEIYLPFYMQEFISKGIELDINDLPNDLKFGVGFRIPTQNVNSIENFKIKGFLPVEYGNSVVVPSEITKKAGSDFDIDKLNIYLYNYKINPETNKPEKIKFLDNSNSTPKERYKKLQKATNFYEFLNTKEGYEYFKSSLDQASTKLISNLFSEDLDDNRIDITKTYDENLGLAKEAAENEKEELPTFEEFKLLPIEQQNSRKAVENAYIDNIRNILELPEMFEHLTTPNSAEELKQQAKEINALYGINKEVKKSDYHLSRVNNAQDRHAFLVGKDAVGIGASQQTQNAVGQVVNLAFKEVKEKFHLDFPTNSTKNGDVTIYSLSSKLDKAGKVISDTISMFIDSFVDIAKDPYIFDINGNLDTASIYITGVRLGIPLPLLTRWFNQPIVREYIKMSQQNKSISTDLKGNKLKKRELLAKLQEQFKTGELKERNTDFTESELDGFIKEYVNQEETKLIQNEDGDVVNDETKGLSQEFRDAQGQLLNQFIQLQDLSWDLFRFGQAINLDTARTVSFESIRIKMAKVAIALDGRFGSYVKDVFDNTFIGSIYNTKKEVLDSIKPLYLTESDKARLVLNPILNNIYNSIGKQAVLEEEAKKLRKHFVTYLLQTIPFKFGANSQPVLLTSYINNLLLSNKNIALQLREIQGLQEENKLPKNFFTKNLLGEIPAFISKNLQKTNNVRLLRKMSDVIDSDLASSDFRNLANHPLTEPFLQDLIRTSLLQSGLNVDTFSFSQIIPNEIFQDIANQINSYFDNEKIDDILKGFTDSYYKNQWYNQDIVPKASTKKTTIDKETGKQKDRAVVWVPGYKPFLEYFVESDTSERPIFSKEAQNPYLIVKSVKQDLDGTPKYSKYETEQMAKKGDFSFLEVTLYKRLEIHNTDTGLMDIPLAKQKYFTDKKTKLDVHGYIILYYPVDAYGERFNLIEHYISNQPSKINTNQKPLDPVKLHKYLSENNKMSGRFVFQHIFPNLQQESEDFISVLDRTLNENMELQIPIEQEVIEQPIQNKEGIDFVFEQSPELAKIGSKEQYSSYISTIFPESKVKDIVYHGSNSLFEVFDKKFLGKNLGQISKDTKLGFFFGNQKEIKGYGKNSYSVVLNIKNPEIISSEKYVNIVKNDAENRKVALRIEPRTFDSKLVFPIIQSAIIHDKDGVIFEDIIDYSKGNQQVVFESEQIHILGSKQDIEGFKKFIEQPINKEIKPNEVNLSNNWNNLQENLFSNIEKSKNYKDYKKVQLDRTTVNTKPVYDISNKYKSLEKPLQIKALTDLTYVIFTRNGIPTYSEIENIISSFKDDNSSYLEKFKVLLTGQNGKDVSALNLEYLSNREFSLNQIDLQNKLLLVSIDFINDKLSKLNKSLLNYPITVEENSKKDNFTVTKNNKSIESVENEVDKSIYKLSWEVGKKGLTAENYKGLCNLTAKSCIKSLRRIGIDAYPYEIPISSQNPVYLDKLMEHFVALVNLNNILYIYDQPQTEFLKPSKDNKNTFDYVSEYNPRFIELNADNLVKNYGLSKEIAEKTITLILNTKISKYSVKEYIEDTNNVNQPTEIKPKIEVSEINYTKNTPNDKSKGFFFTENLQAYLANRGRGAEVRFDLAPKDVKLDVTATNNQAGIRRNNGIRNLNAFAIISKKYQQNGSGSFVKEEGQFKDTDEDFELFKKYNTEAIDEAIAYNKPLVIAEAGIATGKSALPLRFAEWLNNELKTKLGIQGTIKENTSTGYKGYGIFNLTQEQPIVEETLQLKDGKNYNKSEINTKLLESLGYTPSEIGKILKEIC